MGDNKDFNEKNLLKMLDKPDVRRKIQDIIREEGKEEERMSLLNAVKENAELKKRLERERTEKEGLYMELERLRAENKKLTGININLDKDIKIIQAEKDRLLSGCKAKDSRYNELKEGYEGQLSRLEQKCQELVKYRELNKKYEMIDYYYNLYLSFSESEHKKLGRILSGESPEQFLAWGTQWDNIRALWTEISFWLDEYPKDTVDKLIKIFDYFFGIYYENNQKDGTKKYIRQEVEAGDEFDDFLYTRKDGAVAGKITEVLLYGYGETDGEEFILKEKSVVRL